MSSLDKVHIRHTALGDRVVLARVGKDPDVALETRDAMNEFFQAIVSYACGSVMPEPGAGGQVTFGGGDEHFLLTVLRARPGQSPQELAQDKKAFPVDQARLLIGGVIEDYFADDPVLAGHGHSSSLMDRIMDALESAQEKI